MVLDPNIMKAVERLDYRVTAGDVAALAGLELRTAEQGLLALASEAGGHLQVSDAGEMAFQFPPNFRNVLQNKYLRLRIQEWLKRFWNILFYLIRISFGIVLIASIVLIVLAITILLIAMNSARDGDDGGDGGVVFMPNFWFGPDIFWIFYPNYGDRYYERQRAAERRGEAAPRMNFLEAIFSFLFGDGNPNADLEERRWRTIGTVIRNNQGAVIAEQIAPYLDFDRRSLDNEDYMIPVLSRFNGRPEVSPEGDIVYQFPELQVTATDKRARSVPAYLKELPWKFSNANGGQLALAGGLGVFNLVGALFLGGLLGSGAIAAEIGGLVAFVNAIYGVILGYGVAFLVIPLLRYFWVRWRNVGVQNRNTGRQARAEAFNLNLAQLTSKLNFARQFAAQTVVDQKNLAYSTESDLVEQELAQKDKIDAEWQRRLEQSEY